MLEINTTRFGNIIIEEEKIIHFPDGIPGFEDLKRYVFMAEENVNLQEDKLEVFHWLQSVCDASVAFLVVNPFLFIPDYSFDLSDDEVTALELKSPEEIAVFNIITIPGEKAAEVTINLLAPLIINFKLKLAKQVILTGSNYSTKHTLFNNLTKSGAALEQVAEC